MMKQYTEQVLWANSIRNQFQIDGYQSSPTPSCDIIPIPPGTPRKAEVQLLSLLYKNNLLNQSLYNIGPSPSPLCRRCNQEEETAEHILFNCSHIDYQMRATARYNYKLALQVSEDAHEPEFYIGLLNAIRNVEFVKSCLEIVTTINIDVTIEL